MRIWPWKVRVKSNPIPEDVRKRAYDIVLREQMQEEGYAEHSETIVPILTILHCALTLDELQRQREVVTKEIMKHKTAPDFGEEGVEEWKDYAETLSLKYEYEVRMLMAKISRGPGQ